MYYTYRISKKIAYVRTGGGVQANVCVLRTGAWSKIGNILFTYFTDGPHVL